MNMDQWQTGQNGGRETRSLKSPSPNKPKAATTTGAEAMSREVSMSEALAPFQLMLQDASVTLISPAYEERDFTLEEILELGDNCLGLKVLLTAKQGSCLGVINMILTPCRKISLEKVSNPSTGKKKLGLRTFFFQDVVSIRVLGEDREARQRLLKDIYFEKKQGKKLLRKKLLPIHLQEKCRNNMAEEEEVVPGLIQQLVCEEASAQEGRPPPPPPPPSPPSGKKCLRPSRWVVIDVIDDPYKKALSIISNEKVISLSTTGLGLGRSGTLVWMSVATSSMIFHFDVAKIGPSEVMEAGLGSVLGDEGVVKVVHDCRALEDLLHHQLNINLSNVFDTQAAEIYLHLVNNHGSVPLLVPTLPSLLAKYLCVTPQYGQHSQVDESLWLERPLVEPLGERLARDVLYLRELRVEQLNRMLVDLRQITEIYLGAMRDKDSLTVSQLEPQVVPAEVQRLGRQSGARVKSDGIPFVHFSKSHH